MGVPGLITTTGLMTLIFYSFPQVVTAVLCQRALMCLIALDEACVFTMTCANVIRSGLVKTVPSFLVGLSTIALVRVLSCHFPHFEFSKPSLN